jgi:hypothetical protein
MSAHNIISQINDGTDGQGKVLMFKTSAPTTGVVGISKGALWLDSSTGVMYQNSGTTTSASWTAVSPSYGTGITGSIRVARMFQDAANGTDALDMLWIGDSNTAYNGKGWTDGFAAAMHFNGAKMYATPAYQSFGSGAVIGYKMWPFGWPSAGSPTGAVAGSGSANVSAALKATMGIGTGTLRPNGVQLDFLRVESGTTLAQGETLSLWMYEQGPNPTTVAADDAFTDVCPIGINDQLIARVQVNIGSGSPNGQIALAFNDKAQANISTATFNTPSPSADQWEIKELTLNANNSRIAPYQGSTSAENKYRLVMCGSGGGTPGIRGPISIGLWSVYRYVKGFASSPLHYRGSATLSTISTDVVQATNNGNAVQNYLKYLRERQRSVSGATGRVVVCIQGGVNSGDWYPSSPSTAITAINNIRSAISSAWTSLGYPSSDLGFLVMISHPTNSDDSDSSLSALRTLAQTTYSSPEGDTLNVNLNSIYPWSRIAMNGFFDRNDLSTSNYDTSYAHLEENRHGYEVIASAVVSSIMRTK